VNRPIAALVALAIAYAAMAVAVAIPWPGFEPGPKSELNVSRVHGTSMAPTINENDLIYWRKVDPSEVVIGDLIVYVHPTVPNPPLIVHRVVEIRVEDGHYYFRTKGDNLPYLDRYWVDENHLMGIVVK
jgi:signal peptidase